jgi:hypothetical protein
VVSYSFDGIEATIKRSDGDSLVLPEDLRFGWLQRDAIRLSMKLSKFLKETGPEPRPKYTRDQIHQMSSDETRFLINSEDGDFAEACAFHEGDKRIFDISADGLYRGIRNRNLRLVPWYEKLIARYSDALGDEVSRFRNRLVMEGVSDDGVLSLPVESFVALENLQIISKKLWELAYEVGQKDQQ